MEFKYLQTVQENLPEVEERMRAHLECNSSFVVQGIRDLIFKDGKKIRPAITLSIGEMLGADTDRILDLAAAIEMLYAAMLVHDDLIDGAILHSGSGSVSAAWPQAATVLAGDFVFAMAAKLAADTKSTIVMEMFAKTLATIVNGEITNIFRNGSGLDRHAYYLWIYAKSASLVELAASASAILAKADTDIVRAASRFGYSLGMALQIVDHALGFIGRGEENNYPAASDLRQGIFTLPVVYYAETHPDDPELRSILSRSGHKNGNFEQLIKAIRQSKAITLSLDDVGTYLLAAHQALSELPDSPQRDALGELTDSILAREEFDLLDILLD